MSKLETNTAAYAPQFKAWRAAMGPKPTEAQLATAHGLGCRPGKQALAIAMALREVGVSNSQIIAACGNPQLNKMRGLISDAYLKREMVPANEAGHTVYKLHVTKKGEGRIARTLTAQAKAEAEGAGEAPAKPVKKAKAKRTADKLPKVSPVDVQTGEPEATANEPTVTGEADTAQAGQV